MQKHMGFLAKRIFLNKDIDNNYFIDICFTHKNERLLWYCQKGGLGMMYGICFDEKISEIFEYWLSRI